jgi:hypothetical protein
MRSNKSKYGGRRRQESKTKILFRLPVAIGYANNKNTKAISKG